MTPASLHGEITSTPARWQQKAAICPRASGSWPLRRLVHHDTGPIIPQPFHMLRSGQLREVVLQAVLAPLFQSDSTALILSLGLGVRRLEGEADAFPL